MGGIGTMGVLMGMAALNKTTTFMNMERQRKQQDYEASVARANASALRNQRDAARAQGRIEQENLDRRKEQLHRSYNELQGRNIATLGAGNVDLTSGSAAAALEGNAARYADDVGENAYAKSLARWQTDTQADALNYQADRYDAQGSYLKKTSGNLLTSWLGSDLAAAGTLLGVGGAGAWGGAGKSSPGGDFLGTARRVQKKIPGV